MRSRSSYGIGVFSIQASLHPEFEKWFERLEKKHDIIDELKWSSLEKANEIDFVVDLAKSILHSKFAFRRLPPLLSAIRSEHARAIPAQDNAVASLHLYGK